MSINIVNSFDCDGVIDIEGPGVYPGPNDIIITGRSFEEQEETLKMLNARGIFNDVYFNAIKFDDKTRESSGHHKAATINRIKHEGIHIRLHFEDDPIQRDIIQQECPWLTVVYLQHNLTEMENVRRN